ncbi:hypothetical protein GGR56DRAFT_639296 [Xylariaceae sp. FL0804]|nr:hypothetical protein GGR56DRAFT_639296 [Xylariaceae sp. FL0804]
MVACQPGWTRHECASILVPHPLFGSEYIIECRGGGAATRLSQSGCPPSITRSCASFTALFFLSDDYKSSTLERSRGRRPGQVRRFLLRATKPKVIEFHHRRRQRHIRWSWHGGGDDLGRAFVKRARVATAASHAIDLPKGQGSTFARRRRRSSFFPNQLRQRSDFASSRIAKSPVRATPSPLLSPWSLFPLQQAVVCLLICIACRAPVCDTGL